MNLSVNPSAFFVISVDIDYVRLDNYPSLSRLQVISLLESKRRIQKLLPGVEKFKVFKNVGGFPEEVRRCNPQLPHWMSLFPAHWSFNHSNTNFLSQSKLLLNCFAHWIPSIHTKCGTLKASWWTSFKTPPCSFKLKATIAEKEEFRAMIFWGNIEMCFIVCLRREQCSNPSRFWVIIKPIIKIVQRTNLTDFGPENQVKQ